MRKSVLTGILACTLIFVSQSAKAEASEIATVNTNDSTLTVVDIETVSETPKSPLLSMIETKNEIVLNTEEIKPVVHIVAENETLSTIAVQYKTTWERIYSKNTQIEDPNIVSAGAQITIPEATEELEPRIAPVVVAKPVVAAKSVAKTKAAPVAQTSSKGASAGNGYVAGYCTWYVKNRRPDLPNNLGNASSWISRANAQGMATGSEPRAGAVGQRNNHVVYVESVNGDGTITISDMNYQARHAITTRVVPANQFRYIY